MENIKSNLITKLFIITLFITVGLQAQDKHSDYIKVFKSTKNFEATVKTIKDNAGEKGWVVLGVKMMHKNLKNAGYDIRPVAIIELCNPKFAGELLKADKTRMFSALMPCRVSVYEQEDGTVQLAMLNSYLAGDLYKELDLKILLKATVQMEEMINN